MRAGIGLLLIVLGGTIGYLVIAGKLPTPQAGTSTSSPQTSTGTGQTIVPLTTGGSLPTTIHGL